ncbi:MAG: glutathione-disulfide reductase [Hyphomonadaceae bacterium]
MADFDYDLFVIGAGSGGVRAARIAALAGARVAIAEEYRIGGTCVIRGCVPKKLLVYGSDFGQAFEDARAFGWSAEDVRFDWKTLRDNVQAEVSRLSGLYEANLKKAGVEIFADRAEVTGPNGVELKKAKRGVTAARILVATGGKPRALDNVKGGDLAIDSNDAFLLEKLPESIAIIGGGYIAVEFATIFSGLGVEVTILYRGDRILRGFDDDARAFVEMELRRTGVTILEHAHPQEIAKSGKGYEVTLAGGVKIDAGLVMAAIGRDPSVDGLGLESAGVKVDVHGAVAVDDYSRTNVSSVFAIGDVTDRLQLTPIAIREGHAFADSEFNKRPTKVDHADVPTAVFGRPPIGAVGLTQKQAEDAYGSAHIYKATFRPMKHILAGNEEKMLMKLVVHPENDKVVGVHIVGRDAPEMVQVAAIAVKAGLTKAQWDATVALHPTAAEELVLMKERAN